MCVELVNASAVIVAHDVNLSIFKPLWLVRQSILSEEDVADHSVISPGLVRIPAPRFELLVLPDRVQLRPARDSEQAQSDLLRILGGIVSALPHTPFTAIGLNFDYKITPEGDVAFEAWDRRQFGAPFSLAAIDEEQEDARFGAYFSCNALQMRLNADIKPMRAPDKTEAKNAPSATSEEVIRGKFNFHRDLTQSPAVSEILEVLGRWDAAASFAETLARRASGGAAEEG